MSSEWGPWVEHDGKGCPLPGKRLCQIVFADGDFMEHFITRKSWMWDWSMCDAAMEPESRIIRYRIRKPKGLTILEGLLEHPPNEVDA